MTSSERPLYVAVCGAADAGEPDVALAEAATPAFQSYAAQVISNARALAAALAAEGVRPVSGGTDTHLALRLGSPS